MHPARLVGLMFLVVGLVALVLLIWLPAEIPLPRWVAIPGPVLGALGLAMVVHPGPKPPGDEFDFEDWFDECELRDKAIYLGAALVGLGLGAYLFVSEGWLAKTADDLERDLDVDLG